MPYVMVPVPEQHVAEVMQFVLAAITRASIRAWDAESIGHLYADVDEGSRSLLAFVARASVGGGELDAADAARMIQMSTRDVAGIVNELNGRARDEGRAILITARNVTDRLPNGRVTEKRVLQIAGDVAELVHEAEQEELRAAGGDLLGGATG